LVGQSVGGGVKKHVQSGYWPFEERESTGNGSKENTAVRNSFKQWQTIGTPPEGRLTGHIKEEQSNDPNHDSLDFKEWRLRCLGETRRVPPPGYRVSLGTGGRWVSFKRLRRQRVSLPFASNKK